MPIRDRGLSESMIRTLWGEFNGLVHEEAMQATQEALKELLRESLDGELARIVGCVRDERSENRTTYRHGSYARTLGTSVGEIAFRMPRAEGVNWDKKVLRDYQRRGVVDEFRTLDLAMKPSEKERLPSIACVAAANRQARPACP